MRYRIAPPPFQGRYFKSRLIELPILGASVKCTATDILQLLYRTPARPGLMVHRTTIFSPSGCCNSAWSHEFEHGILAVMSDLSMLIFARSEDPDLFEMLPLVFKIPKELPAAPDGSATHSNLRFKKQRAQPAILGIHHVDRDAARHDITAPDAAPAPLRDIHRHALAALEEESLAWIKSYRKTKIDPKTSWPIALSAINAPDVGNEPERVLMLWLSKICTLVARLTKSNSPNPIGITLRQPSFSQEDGRMHFDIQVRTADDASSKMSAMAAYLCGRIADLLSEGKTPFDLSALFPRISIDEENAFMATSIRHVDIYIEAFAIVSMSNHEALQLDADLGLRKHLADTNAQK